VVATLGGALFAPWQWLALITAVRPGGLMALAAITLTCLLLALLARIAAAVTAAPLTAGTEALREKSWRAGVVPQCDPDAPGRARPRAPTGSPAAI
jgi:hypothetical protein